MNIIVAILFDNYEDHDTGEIEEEHLELELKAKAIGIPKAISDIIIRKDLVLDAKSKSSFTKQMKKYGYSLITKDQKLKIPDSKYFSYRVTRFLYTVVNHEAFQLFIFIIIGLNTITLSLDIYSLDDGPKVIPALEYFNYFFFAIFTIECVMKFFGLGAKEFVRDKFNIFDTFVVIISLIEIILASGSSGAFTSLRAFRLFRIFKIFRVGDLRILIDCLTKTMKAISPFVICLFLFMYIFTLMGMQFFAGNVRFNDEGQPDSNGTSPRYNFDRFDNAILSVFIIFTGENWNEMMYDAMRATHPIACFYFVVVIVIGNIIILQLLVAIVLSNFDHSRKETGKRKIIDEIESKLEDGSNMIDAIQAVLGKDFILEAEGDVEKASEDPKAIKATLKRLKSFKIFNHRRQSSRNVLISPRERVYFAGDEEGEETKKSQKNQSELPPIKSEDDKLESDDHFFHKNSFDLPSEMADDMSIHLDANMATGKLNGFDEYHIAKTNTRITNTVVPINFGRRIASESEEYKSKSSPSKPNQFQIDRPFSSSSFKDSSPRRVPDKIYKISKVTTVVEEVPWYQKVKDYINTTSILLFKSDWKFRQIILIIVSSQEDVVCATKAEMLPEKYGIEDINKSQKFGIIDINSGKVLPKRKLKIFSRIFEYFIVAIILLSCIILCIDTPLNNPDTVGSKILVALDIIFSAIFFVECILKIMALGFFWNNYQGVTAYIRSPWNVLDFLVVVVSLVDVYYTYISASSTENLSSIKALRAIRALRPLRMISRNEGLKIAIQALLASLPAMGNVLIICMLFLLIFAILGLNFFFGKFYYCAESYGDLLEKVTDWRTCLSSGGRWINRGPNFDNVAISCITLFEMMTTEGWVDVMSNGIDATGLEKQPKLNNTPYAALYFVIFMVLGCFLIVNLFTAVITDNFNKIKQSHEIGAGEVVNECQKQWVDIQNMAIKVFPVKRPKAPESPKRHFIFKMVMSPGFDLIIIVMIILNTLVIAMTHARMSDSYALAIEIINYLFVFCYNIECILKIIGLGFQYFTHDTWNLFDFICVAGSDLSLIFVIAEVEGPIQSIFIFLRAFRMVRLLRFVNNYGGAQTISTLIYAAPQIKNIITLISLITFIYAALGINLFGAVMYRDNYNDQNNFRNIFDALLLLLRCMTGEDWGRIMHDLASSEVYENER